MDSELCLGNGMPSDDVLTRRSVSTRCHMSQLAKGFLRILHEEHYPMGESILSRRKGCDSGREMTSFDSHSGHPANRVAYHGTLQRAKLAYGRDNVSRSCTVESFFLLYFRTPPLGTAHSAKNVKGAIQWHGAHDNATRKHGQACESCRCLLLLDLD